MPPLQLTYPETMAPYALGRRVNMEEWNTLTGLAQVDTIGFAEPVQDGTTGEQVAPFTSGKFRGITEADYGINVATPTTAARFPIGANVPVCESGVIAGLAVGTCTKRTPVYWVAASRGYTSTASTNTLIPNAEFDATVSSGGLVPIRLRRIPPAA